MHHPDWRRSRTVHRAFQRCNGSAGERLPNQRLPSSPKMHRGGNPKIAAPHAMPSRTLARPAPPGPATPHPSGPRLPCHACRARPRLAQPRRATPSHACPAGPSRAVPRPASPCPAKPRLPFRACRAASSRPDLSACPTPLPGNLPSSGGCCQCLPCPARPGPASPGHVAPRLPCPAAPRRAVPRLAAAIVASPAPIG